LIFGERGSHDEKLLSGKYSLNYTYERINEIMQHIESMCDGLHEY